MPTKISAVIDKAIYDWIIGQVSAKFGAKVIWSMQTSEGDLVGTRLPLPFVRMSILNTGKKKGSTNVSSTENEGEFNYSWVQDFTFQVEVFAQDNHFEIAEEIQTSLKLPTVFEKLRSAGLSLVNYTDVIDTSMVLNGRYELRAQFDIFFSYIKERVDSPSEITEVGINGDVEGFPIEISINKENA